LIAATTGFSHASTRIIARENRSMKTCIAGLRHLLGDDPDAPTFIETVQRLGYRFIAPVAVSNVPARATSLIGRERELAEIKRLLATSRLVTLVGPAGAGKTSLATQVAADLLPALPHGACWVELAAVSDPDHVGEAVATTLGVRDHAQVPMADTVADALQDREMLLVLDNCEHVVEAAADLVDMVLRVCPHMRVLATSREGLGVDREIAWLVPPLSVSDAAAPPSALLACEAVRLFVERASDSSPSFTVTEQNAATIADICRRLDGLPLAIELAAVRVKVLAPEQIAARLDDALDLLGRPPRTRQARHQTLTRAIDWSYDLLTPRERLALSVLSVFAGSFTLTAAEAVCVCTAEIAAADVLDLMARLVDRSLVTVVHREPAHERRYRLLETIRQYARRKIPPHLAEAVPRSHAEFFMRFAEEIEPSMNSAGREACLARLGAEYGNLRAALEWSRAGGDPRVGLRIAGALWQYWMHCGRWGEGRVWLDTLIARDPGAPAPVRALALGGSGMLAFFLGDAPLARASLEESVALWRTTDDELGLGFALRMMGELRLWQGDLEGSEALIGEAVRLLRHVGAYWKMVV
jgi:non-specific serine/threonine protein kinase